MESSSKQALRRYLADHFNAIEGWCWAYIWQPLEYIDRRQRELGETGPVGEIGVFKGKFFCGMAALKHDATSHLVLDVFEMQQFSLAGDGSRIRVPRHLTDHLQEAFVDNLRRTGVDLATVNIIKGDSVSYTPAELRAEIKDFRKFSLFSVDGCHEFTHAYNDIQIAMDLTSTFGVIYVDDYLHAQWPGVHEAVAKLYFSSAPRFVPLYYVHNKLALCHVNMHNDYYNGLLRFYEENYPRLPIRRVTRYGWPTLTIEPRSEFDVVVGLPEADLKKA